ncbi:MAG: TolC family protein, partial [Bacteroidota bacterium]
MTHHKKIVYTGLFSLLFLWQACKVPLLLEKKENRDLTGAYNTKTDTLNVSSISWKDYFGDQYLIGLIDTALANNQELNIVKQEIEISRNEIRVRKGEYIPFVGMTGGLGYEKIGKYTWRGGVEKNLSNTNQPEILESKSDFIFGPSASWELDVWKKLRNAKDAAVQRYLGSIDGKNYLITTLISEISNSYYELLALDNLLQIVQRNIVIQSDALNVVKAQKDAAKVTLLAVNRFEAQLLRTQNLQYD